MIGINAVGSAANSGVAEKNTGALAAPDKAMPVTSSIATIVNTGKPGAVRLPT